MKRTTLAALAATLMIGGAPLALAQQPGQAGQWGQTGQAAQQQQWGQQWGPQDAQRGYGQHQLGQQPRRQLEQEWPRVQDFDRPGRQPERGFAERQPWEADGTRQARDPWTAGGEPEGRQQWTERPIGEDPRFAQPRAGMPQQQQQQREQQNERLARALRQAGYSDVEQVGPGVMRARDPDGEMVFIQTQDMAPGGATGTVGPRTGMTGQQTFGWQRGREFGRNGEPAGGGEQPAR